MAKMSNSNIEAPRERKGQIGRRRGTSFSDTNDTGGIHLAVVSEQSQIEKEKIETPEIFNDIDIPPYEEFLEILDNSESIGELKDDLQQNYSLIVGHLNHSSDQKSLKENPDINDYHRKSKDIDTFLNNELVAPGIHSEQVTNINYKVLSELLSLTEQLRDTLSEDGDVTFGDKKEANEVGEKKIFFSTGESVIGTDKEGKPEEGWIFERYDKNTGKAKIKKIKHDGSKKEIVISIPLAELRELNMTEDNESVDRENAQNEVAKDEEKEIQQNLNNEQRSQKQGEESVEGEKLALREQITQAEQDDNEEKVLALEKELQTLEKKFGTLDSKDVESVKGSINDAGSSEPDSSENKPDNNVGDSPSIEDTGGNGGGDGGDTKGPNKTEYQTARENWKKTQEEYRSIKNEYNAAREEYYNNLPKLSLYRRILGKDVELSSDFKEKENQYKAARSRYARGLDSAIEQRNTQESYEEQEDSKERHNEAFLNKFILDEIKQTRALQNEALPFARKSLVGNIFGRLNGIPKWGRYVGTAVFSSGIGVASGGLSALPVVAARLGFGVTAGATLGVMAGNKARSFVGEKFGRKIEEQEEVIKTEEERVHTDFDIEKIDSLEASLQGAYDREKRLKENKDIAEKAAGIAAAAGVGFLAGRAGSEIGEIAMDFVSPAHTPGVGSKSEVITDEALIEGGKPSAESLSAHALANSAPEVTSTAQETGIESGEISDEILADAGRVVPPTEQTLVGETGGAPSAEAVQERIGGLVDAPIEPDIVANTPETGLDTLESNPYTVQSGDNLWKITRNEYSDILDSLPKEKQNLALSQLFDELKNDGKMKTALGMRSSDPNLIYPNEKLELNVLGERLQEIIDESDFESSVPSSDPIPTGYESAEEFLNDPAVDFGGGEPQTPSPYAEDGPDLRTPEQISRGDAPIYEAVPWGEEAPGIEDQPISGGVDVVPEVESAPITPTNEAAKIFEEQTGLKLSDSADTLDSHSYTENAAVSHQEFSPALLEQTKGSLVDLINNKKTGFLSLFSNPPTDTYEKLAGQTMGELSQMNSESLAALDIHENDWERFGGLIEDWRQVSEIDRSLTLSEYLDKHSENVLSQPNITNRIA